MTAQMPDLQAVLECVEKLERQNRRLKQAGLAISVIVLATLMMGPARPTRTVVASKFVLEDLNGNPRTVLEMASAGPSLTFYDSKGRPRVELALLKRDTPFFTIEGEDGAHVALNPGGSSPSVELKDSRGAYAQMTVQAVESEGKAGSVSSFSLDNADGSRASLGLIGGKAQLVLVNADGSRWNAPR